MQAKIFIVFIISTIILTGFTVPSFAEGQGKGNDSGKGNPSQGIAACENSNDNGKARDKNPHCTADDDNDTVPNYLDQCPDEDASGFDTNMDGCIDDTDGDGINDKVDECPLIPGVLEFNGCPIPDQDSDGIPDESDNCPAIPNADQLDTDNDGIGDVCDETPTGDSEANLGLIIGTSSKVWNLVDSSIGFFVHQGGPESVVTDGIVTYIVQSPNIILLDTPGCVIVGNTATCELRPMAINYAYGAGINFYAQWTTEHPTGQIDVSVTSSAFDPDLSNNSATITVSFFPDLPNAPPPDHPPIFP